MERISYEFLVEKMRIIWREFLFDASDVDGDFYELGGDSLLTFQLLEKIESVFGVRISLLEFYPSSHFMDCVRLVENKLSLVGANSLEEADKRGR